MYYSLVTQSMNQICKQMRQCLWADLPQLLTKASVSHQMLHMCSCTSDDLDSILVAHRHNIIRCTYARKLALSIAKNGGDNLKALQFREYEFVQGQVTAKYRSNNVFFDIDCSVWSAAERRLLLDVIRHLCAHRHVLGGRHVIVVHNVHALNQSLTQSLKKILETVKSQAVLICSSATIATNITLHAGVCVPVRCDEPKLLVHCVRSSSVTTKDAEEALVRHNRDLMSASFDLFAQRDGDKYSNALDVRARGMISQLRQFCAQRTSAGTVIEALDKWALEIVGLALPFDALLHSIVRALDDGDDNKMARIVELCASAQERYVKANKVAPVIDQFLWNLYHVLLQSTE